MNNQKSSSADWHWQFSSVVFRSLDRIQHAAYDIFTRTMGNVGVVGVLPRDKVQNFQGQIEVLQTFVSPYLSKDYIKESERIKSEIERYDKDDVWERFRLCNELLQALMHEVYSAGFLPRSGAEEEPGEGFGDEKHEQ